jgi:tRNA threonylcarbamoyladenosine biosynthesis protein TsaB
LSVIGTQIALVTPAFLPDFRYNRYVKILAIDTSTQAGGVAALEDGRVLSAAFERSERPYSARLFENIDFLLAELKLAIPDFDLFAVAAGPGSFTGLRIGLTAVKGWAELYQKPIAAVSGLHAIAAQCTVNFPLVAAVMDARRGQVFGGVYRRTRDALVLAAEEVVTCAEEFVAETARFAGDRAVAFVSPSPELLTSALESVSLREFTVVRAAEDLAPWIGQIGRLLFEHGEVVDALSLDANYVRRSDAELYWKEP